MPIEPAPVDTARLERALGMLPAAERNLYLLCARDGVTLEAAAAMLGLEPEAAGRLLARAVLDLDAALRRKPHPWWRFW